MTYTELSNQFFLKAQKGCKVTPSREWYATMISGKQFNWLQSLFGCKFSCESINKEDWIARYEKAPNGSYKVTFTSESRKQLL